jgi:hypothetical protein
MFLHSLFVCPEKIMLYGGIQQIIPGLPHIATPDGFVYIDTGSQLVEIIFHVICAW